MRVVMKIDTDIYASPSLNTNSISSTMSPSSENLDFGLAWILILIKIDRLQQDGVFTAN